MFAVEATTGPVFVSASIAADDETTASLLGPLPMLCEPATAEELRMLLLEDGSAINGDERLVQTPLGADDGDNRGGGGCGGS